MTTTSGFVGQQRTRPTKDEQARSSVRSDLLVSFFATLCVAGLYLDGWAHAHNKVDKTFFTPWHAFLYSGFVATATVIVTMILRNRARGSGWSKAVPSGYGAAVLGIPLFLLAGGADLLWHRVFGFEVGIEQLLSPSHIALAFGGVLTISGPLCAALRRADGDAASGWRSLLPMLLSVTALWSVLTFFTVYADPFAETEGATNPIYSHYSIYNALGVAGIFLQTVLLVGFVLIMVRRWRLPMGTFTLMLTINMIGRAVVNDEYELIPTAVLAGVIADLLYWLLQPSMERVGRVRLFVFVMPTGLYLLYFATLSRLSGIALSATLWLGSTVLAGVIGVLLSYVMIPPGSASVEPAGNDAKAVALVPDGSPTGLASPHEVSSEPVLSQQADAHGQQERVHPPHRSRRAVLVGMLGLGVGMGGLIYEERVWLPRLLGPFLNTAGTLSLVALSPIPHATGYRPSTYHRYASAVSSVAWSPTGKYLASASNDGMVQVWDASTGHTLLTYQSQSGAVTCVAWSLDSRYLASAHDDGTVQVWVVVQRGRGVAPGKPILIYQGHRASVLSIAWSPDSQRLASASADKTVQIWDASTGRTLLAYRKHTGAVQSVAWSPDGRRLASAGDDGTVQLWDVSTGHTLLTYSEHTGTVNSVAWSPISRHLASAGDDGTIQVWDTSTGTSLLVYQSQNGAILNITWSPDGKHLASACSDKTARVWDTSTSELLFSYQGHLSAVNSVTWSPDGRHLASASDDRTVQFWDSSVGMTLLTYRKHNGSVYNVAWSPNGQRLASIDDDATQVWDAATGTLLLSYQGQQKAFLNRERRSGGAAFVFTNSTAMALRDALRDSIFPTNEKQGKSGGGRPMILCVAWSPDGRRLASMGNDRIVRVWDAFTGSTLLTYHKHAEIDSPYGISCVAWSPDGTRIVSANCSGRVYVWNASTGVTLLTYRKRTESESLGAVNSVAWSPGGKEIALADNDGAVRLWDTAADTIRLTYLGHVGSVHAVAWSPDGQRLASTSDDQTLQIWYASTGTPLLSCKNGDSGFRNSLAWSPDSRYLASASGNQLVQVWDAAQPGNDQTTRVWNAAQTGDPSLNALLLTYQGHDSDVYGLAWSPDGQCLASAGGDQTVQVWRAK